ncbi:hypothetical protein NA66_10488 [Burkholderia pyrrocinia]|uniref:Uncharacterized protein n=1 Tax=Burkholderia pyrrocinia TaxID=60550 RepID=A0A318HSZ6_BURPY|nr:hypothetical protein NA66_10488 [Burkholderia pyrrocinia]SFW90368.1 hypothetical protein SAMN03159384_06999 [Burkholderia sp. NFACC33-1]SFY46458.1 hypothetical protein SAMN03159408_06995 [Burkholderia sp. NFPP32]
MEASRKALKSFAILPFLPRDVSHFHDMWRTGLNTNRIIGNPPRF